MLAHSSRWHGASVGAAYIITEKPCDVPIGPIAKALELQPRQRKAFLENLATSVGGYTMTPFPWAGSPYLAEGIKNFPCTTDIFHGNALFLDRGPPYEAGAVGLLGVVAQFPAAPGHGSRSVDWLLPTISGRIQWQKRRFQRHSILKILPVMTRGMLS